MLQVLGPTTCYKCNVVFKDSEAFQIETHTCWPKIIITQELPNQGSYGQQSGNITAQVILENPLGWQCTLCKIVHSPDTKFCACAVYEDMYRNKP